MIPLRKALAPPTARPWCEPPDPAGEWRLLGPPPDNSIGTPRPATARMTGALVDRPQLGRTHETVAYLARN